MAEGFKLDFCFKQVSNGIHTIFNIKSWFLWLITKNANGGGVYFIFKGS